MITSPTDPTMAMANLQQQDMVQKKLNMDQLRSNLNNAPDKEAKLREACEGFESVFIQKIWEQMRKNVQSDGYLHSRDEQMYQGMYDAEFSKKLASAGGIGLADMLYEQLAQRLGESSRTTSPSNSPKLPIIPASSAPSKIAGQVKGLNEPDNAGIALKTNQGIPLNNPLMPVYEEVEEYSNTPELNNAAQATQAMPYAQQNAAEPDFSNAAAPVLQAAPLGAQNMAQAAEAQTNVQNFDSDLDFEAISQQMLLQEQAEGETEDAPVYSGPVANVLKQQEEDILQAALNENTREVAGTGQEQLAGLLRRYPLGSGENRES